MALPSTTNCPSFVRKTPPNTAISLLKGLAPYINMQIDCCFAERDRERQMDSERLAELLS